MTPLLPYCFWVALGHYVNIQICSLDLHIQANAYTDRFLSPHGVCATGRMPQKVISLSLLCQILLSFSITELSICLL